MKSIPAIVAAGLMFTALAAMGMWIAWSTLHS